MRSGAWRDDEVGTQMVESAKSRRGFQIHPAKDSIPSAKRSPGMRSSFDFRARKNFTPHLAGSPPAHRDPIGKYLRETCPGLFARKNGHPVRRHRPTGRRRERIDRLSTHRFLRQALTERRGIRRFPGFRLVHRDVPELTEPLNRCKFQIWMRW
jgi:hypothetical protein